MTTMLQVFIDTAYLNVQKLTKAEALAMLGHGWKTDYTRKLAGAWSQSLDDRVTKLVAKRAGIL